MKPALREAILDLLVLAGAGCIVRGAFAFSHALGYVVLGVMMLGLGILGLLHVARGGGG